MVLACGMKRSEDMADFDTTNTDEIVCPHCGTEFCVDQAPFWPSDWDEMKQGDFICDECGGEFNFTVVKTVKCSTVKA